MTWGVEIRYGDFAVGAKESFIPTSTTKTYFSNLDQLQKENLVFPNYGNPCELYQCPLDGKSLILPSKNGEVSKNLSIGWWSSEVSGQGGRYMDILPELVLKADGQYSAQGLTLYFDSYNNIRPDEIYVLWFRNGAEIGRYSRYVNSSVFYVEKKVDNFDEIHILFTRINQAQCRSRMYGIDYGEGVVLFGDELEDCKIIQELNPISSEISINTCDFVLKSKRDKEYSFQRKQPLQVYFNDVLKATTFVKSSKRIGKRSWEVKSEDYIGFLDTIPFYGDIYVNKNAVDLLKEIFAVAKVPYEISADFNTSQVTGYIPYETCREALMQVAFSIGAVIDTSNSEVVRVYKLDDRVTQTVNALRIKEGQNFVEEETVTEVSVTAHSYAKGTEDKTVYNAADDGVGSNIFVTFGEPLHTLSITNGSIVEQGTNYAVINANNTSCILTGKTYIHNTTTKSKRNPLVLANEIEKVIAIENATLVSNKNINEALERAFNYLIKNEQINLEIFENIYKTGENVYYEDTPVNVGEVVTVETEYLGNRTGRIERQAFNLEGGILLKDCEVR